MLRGKFQIFVKRKHHIMAIYLILLILSQADAVTRRRLILKQADAAIVAELPEAATLPPGVTPFNDDDGYAHLGPPPASSIVDDPEGTYEKLDDVSETPCDDGMGPNPNILTALPDETERETQQHNGNDNSDGLQTKIERIVSKSVSKFVKYDMTTGALWLKPKKDRIPLCPGAKHRAPVPGIDCTLSKVIPEHTARCCGCGCGGCCGMLLRRVISKTVNKNLHIDMETGKPFKNLPPCADYKEPIVHVVESEPDIPLMSMLNNKVAQDDDKRLIRKGTASTT